MFVSIILRRSFSSSTSRTTSSSSPEPLQTLLKRGFTPTLKSINRLLLFLFQTQRFNSIVHIFSQINSNQIKINSRRTHSILIRALLKCYRYEEAELFMKTQLAKIPILQRNRVCNSLIQGLCFNQKDPGKALFVLRDCLTSHGILPSSFTFCSLIHRFSSQGKMDRVIEVLELMNGEDVNYPFDNFVCSSVISGFCRIGKPEFALKFFENAINSGHFQPNIVTYTSLVSALCRLGKISEVYDLVCRIEKEEGLAFDVVFYSCWISGYITEGALLDVFGKFQKMLENGIRPDTISYTILADGFSKLGNEEKASGFLTKMRKEGLKPNVITYTVIMLGFCKKGKVQEAFSVFRTVRDHGFEADEFMYAILINGFCRVGDFDRVFNLLDEMEHRGVKPSIVTYNTVINGLCKYGKTSEAEKVSKGLEGDVITYTTLLLGYIEEEDTFGIMEIKKRLECSGIRMDLLVRNILMKALFMIGAFEDAYLHYKEIPEMGLVPDSITYCTMINGYCKIGRIEEALEIFNEFVEFNKREPAWNLNIHKRLIRAAFEGKGEVGVVFLVSKMEGLDPELYDIICNDAICFLSKRGFSETASEVYVMMRAKGAQVTVKSYYLILKTQIRDGKKWLSRPLLSNFLKVFGSSEPRVGEILMLYLCIENVSKALSFLDKVKEISFDVTLPVTIFKVLIKEGRVLDAYKLLMNARNNLPVMDVYDCSIVVDSLCKGGYISEALDFCILAQEKRIRLNIVCYNSVINGLCLQGRLIEAFRLFDSLESLGISPSEITYGTLMDALCRSGFLEDARELLDKMVLKGLEPNTHVYNSLVDGYSKKGQTEQALKLISDSAIPNFNTNEFTVSALIHGYFLKGDMEGGLSFFLEFKQKGVLPDFLGFLYLVRGLCSKGRMEEARNVLREMLRSPAVIDLINRIDAENEAEEESVERFLTILCEQGRIQEALTVVNKIGDIFFPIRKLDQSEDCVPSTTASSSRLIEDDEENDEPEDDSKLKEKCKAGGFHSYYSVISSLCSRGEIEKASQLAKLVCYSTKT